MSVPARPRRVLAGYGYGLTVFLSPALLLVLEIGADRVDVHCRCDPGGSVAGQLGRRGMRVPGRVGPWRRAACPACSACRYSTGSTFLFGEMLLSVPAALLGVVTPLSTALALALDGRTGQRTPLVQEFAAAVGTAGTFAAGCWLVRCLASRTGVSALRRRAVRVGGDGCARAKCRIEFEFVPEVRWISGTRTADRISR